MAVDLTALQNASAVVLDQIARDSSIIPDLGDTLTAPGAQASALYSPLPDDTRVPFQKRKFLRIPDAVFQFYEHAQVSTVMGILPEVDRVWISVENKLLLWDYTDGEALSSFVEQEAAIRHVALVRPKPGLFIDDISYLLVVCTPVSVLLLAVSVSSTMVNDTARKEIKLYATDLSVPTEDAMRSVVGMPDGRVFMCGEHDGNLYEFHYQESESWFGKRVQLVNHSVGGVQSFLPRFAAVTSDEHVISVVADHPRNCFYTLSSKSTISIYKPNGDKSVQLVQTISNIYKSAQDKVPGSPALTPDKFTISRLLVVDPAESRAGIQIMAITANGVRLYFSPSYSYGYSFTPSYGSSRPLQLLHVRLPPANLSHPDEQRQVQPYAPALAQQQPPNYRSYSIKDLDDRCCYIDGMSVAVQSGETENDDYILCITPDLSQIGSLNQLAQASQPAHQQYNQTFGNPGSNNRQPLTESAILLSIAGKAWSMASIPRERNSLAGVQAPSITNELATQFGECPQRFAILTNQGLTFLVKRRALDYLKAVLEELPRRGNSQLIEFHNSYGRDQTCAMLLGLASGNAFVEAFDGQPNKTSLKPEILTSATQAFYEVGERPTWTERMTYGQADGQGTTIFSGRREGLALYLSRMLRPIWKAKVTDPSIRPEKTVSLAKQNLSNLKQYLDRNAYLFQPLATDNTSSRLGSRDVEAWKAEQKSTSDLQYLLARTIEALSFVLLLNDFKLPELLARCNSETQAILKSLTYEDLITNQKGISVSKELVSAIIDKHLGQQISVDTISELLQRECGSFCSTEDVVLYKAKEFVQNAAESKDLQERQKLLSESLRLYTKASHGLDLERLGTIVADYQYLCFARGAVAIALRCATILDPDGSGSDFWKASCPPNDPRGAIYEQRLKCYGLVLNSLQVFEQVAATGKPPGHVQLLEEPESVRSEAYEVAFNSEDENFHSTLYDWLIERNLAEDLLETRPAYLEAYLQNEPATVEKYKLLWQFYVKIGEPLLAARVLARLAESDEFEIHLHDRLEYLTLAVGNAKSHPVSAGGRHESAITFLTDLEEKLDVAQVQLEFFNELSPNINDGPEVGERIMQLTKRLFSISELYQHFAVPFQLSELKLLCLHVSEHREDNVVRPIWTEIVANLRDDSDPSSSAEAITSTVVRLGQRLYPSESAFPLQHISGLLVGFSLQNKGTIPFGWGPRVLTQCGVPHADVWDVWHEMYESQVPPFHDQNNVQALSSDIAVLLSDWVDVVMRPQARQKATFPVGRLDMAVEKYLSELHPGRAETRAQYEGIRRMLRRHW